MRGPGGKGRYIVAGLSGYRAKAKARTRARARATWKGPGPGPRLGPGSGSGPGPRPNLPSSGGAGSVAPLCLKQDVGKKLPPVAATLHCRERRGPAYENVGPQRGCGGGTQHSVQAHHAFVQQSARRLCSERRWLCAAPTLAPLLPCCSRLRFGHLAANARRGVFLRFGGWFNDHPRLEQRRSRQQCGLECCPLYEVVDHQCVIATSELWRCTASRH